MRLSFVKGGVEGGEVNVYVRTHTNEYTELLGFMYVNHMADSNGCSSEVLCVHAGTE